MIQDIAGNKYGKLTVLRYTGEKNKAGNAKWECLCSCENKTIATAGDLKSGRVKSCGCLLYNVHKRQNGYDLSGEYGIGYLRRTNDVFYFDKEDFDKVKEHCWRCDGGGYIKTSTNTNSVHQDISMHRFIMGITDSKIRIDHINGNKKDNRKSNLRIATASQNGINRGKNINNTTGFKGVSRNGHGYMARIKKDGKTFYLGTFSTPEKANEVRIKSEKEMFREFAFEEIDK